MSEYDPDDYVAAEREMLGKLTLAHTVHEFQRTLAALAAIDATSAPDALEALQRIHEVGAIRLEAGVISCDDPLGRILRQGAEDADAALDESRLQRVNDQLEADRERQPFTWDARNL